MPQVKKQSAKKKVRAQTGSLLSQATDISFEDEGIKLLVYGKSGTGKTTFWSTFPKPILAVVCSGGKRSGELRSIRDVKGIKKLDLSETDQIPDLCKEVEESGGYKTVVLDHITYLQDLRIKEILGIEDVPVQSFWGLVTQQQYGQVALQMKEYLRCFLDLSANVILIAQEREFNTDNDSELIMPYVGAALTPSVVGWLNPACDYVCQTFIRRKTVEKKITVGGKTKTSTSWGKGVEYCLRTGPDAVYTTKFRVPRGTPLPAELVDPDYTKFISIIEGAP